MPSLQPGTFNGSNGSVIKVEMTGRPAVYLIRATGTSITGVKETVEFYFNVFTKRVHSSPYGILGLGLPGGERTLNRNFKFMGEFELKDARLYLYRSGGWRTAREEKIVIAVDPESGDLVGLSATTRLARYYTTIGLHSGPLKYAFGSLQINEIRRCQSLLD